MSEPEYGQVAKIRSKSGCEWTVVCVLNHAGQKVWSGGILFPLEGMEWEPVETPEEQRLRKEVEDLRHAVDCDREVNEARIAAEKAAERLRQRVAELEKTHSWRDAQKENPPDHGWYLVMRFSLIMPEYYHLPEGWHGVATHGKVKWWKPIILPTTEQEGAGDE